MSGIVANPKPATAKAFFIRRNDGRRVHARNRPRQDRKISYYLGYLRLRYPPDYSGIMLSSMVVSRDIPEISVLECILGGLHIDVDVEPEPDRAMAKLSKSKVDALIVDCDLEGAAGFLRELRNHPLHNSVPMVIFSGSEERRKRAVPNATFTFKKPISVEQAVRTLSAARNMILDGRLRYHRQVLDMAVSLTDSSKRSYSAKFLNLSQGGAKIRLSQPLPLASPVDISFELPGTGRKVKLKAEVSWTDPNGSVGIQFVASAPRAQRNLQLWLERQYFLH